MHVDHVVVNTVDYTVDNIVDHLATRSRLGRRRSVNLPGSTGWTTLWSTVLTSVGR
jgi:hypothetical protein